MAALNFQRIWFTIILFLKMLPLASSFKPVFSILISEALYNGHVELVSVVHLP